jgi:hypothetical protein
MMATLGVHEAMGAKVGLEAIATLVLPQLWSMSMGPLLNVDQFGHFMAVIKSLGSRVESEHSKHLREVKKMEEQTNSFANGNAENPFDFSGGGSSQEVDFEALVKGGGGASAAAPAAAAAVDPWGDGWNDTPDADSSLVSYIARKPTDTSHPCSRASTWPPHRHRHLRPATGPSWARSPSPRRHSTRQHSRPHNQGSLLSLLHHRPSLATRHSARPACNRRPPRSRLEHRRRTGQTTTSTSLRKSPSPSPCRRHCRRTAAPRCSRHDRGRRHSLDRVSAWAEWAEWVWACNPSPSLSQCSPPCLRLPCSPHPRRLPPHHNPRTAPHRDGAAAGSCSRHLRPSPHGVRRRPRLLTGETLIR